MPLILELFFLAVFLENAVRVIKGSALHALEGDESKCIEELIAALDSIAIPERNQVCC